MSTTELNIDQERGAFEAAFIEAPRPTFERHPAGGGDYAGYVDEKTESAFFGWLLLRRAQLEQQAGMPENTARTNAVCSCSISAPCAYCIGG